MTRVPQRAAALAAAGAEVVTGDLRDAASIHAAVRGARVVISSSHGLIGGRANSSTRVDDAGQRLLVDAARTAGVEQFLFVSALGASEQHPMEFFRTKARIEALLPRSGMRYTVVRPGAFMELHSYQLIGKPIRTGKPVMMIGPGTNPKCFVAEQDVASLVIRAIADQRMNGETIEIGGPENLTGTDVVAIYERITGKKARVKHMPLAIPRTLGPLLRFAHPGVANVMQGAMLSETLDQTFDASVLQARYPMQLTRLEDWARAHVARTT